MDRIGILEQELRIHCLNVGNGDCIILELRNAGGATKYGVIDCNRGSRSESPALQKLLKLGATHLSFVCITHPDKDHYTGILDVLEHFGDEVGAFYSFPLDLFRDNRKRMKGLIAKHQQLATSDDPVVSSAALEFLKIIKFAYTHFRNGKWEQMNGFYNLLDPPGFIGVEVICLLPPKRENGTFYQEIESGSVVDNPVKSNNISCAFLIKFRGRQVILGGDATGKNWMAHRRWQERAGKSIASNIAKLPHHGAKADCDDSTLGNFFISVDGSQCAAVISADGKRHPHRETLEWLQKNKVRPYCTNYFKGWGANIRDLLTDAELDPVLRRLLNESADIDKTRSIPCKGDIEILLQDDGSYRINTEFNHFCLCHPKFESGELAAQSALV